jgi:hypothetical protein
LRQLWKAGEGLPLLMEPGHNQPLQLMGDARDVQFP